MGWFNRIMLSNVPFFFRSCEICQDFEDKFVGICLFMDEYFITCINIITINNMSLNCFINFKGCTTFAKIIANHEMYQTLNSRTLDCLCFTRIV